MYMFGRTASMYSIHPLAAAMHSSSRQRLSGIIITYMGGERETLVSHGCMRTSSRLESTFLFPACSHSMALHAHKASPLAVRHVWLTLLHPVVSHSCILHMIQSKKHVSLSRSCSLRMALHAHKASLLAVRHFWKTLLHPVVSFRNLSSLVVAMISARGEAEQVYRR